MTRSNEPGAAGEGTGDSRVISWEEIARHNDPDTSMWIVIDGVVLDVTE